ncbi:MAG: phosphoglucomutase/phosphomannomutase family protein [Candidatus Omnitrophica bacterium]|nr:phosphoglucomutase/phosphomannomutase family protein [Candidatus Omnitrophota bacterium]
MQRIVFGTDGFRGLIADNFTFENVRRIARAVAAHVRRQPLAEKRRGVVIGYDRRFLSREFAAAAAEEIRQQGIPVLFSDAPVPTPAVSACIRTRGLPAGLVITASHNPPAFNGVKIKDRHGASATQELTAEIEALANAAVAPTARRARPARLTEASLVDSYVEQVRAYIDFDTLKRQRFHILVDPMFGAGSGVLAKALAGSRCRITEINAEDNPLFGGVNPEPIAVNLRRLSAAVRAAPCDIALAFDGDADRIGAMCPDGRFINSHYAICLILLHLIEHRRWRGRVLKSLNTTSMVDRIAAHYRLPLVELPVGFKYIAAEMLKGDVLLGGEESGGIGVKDYMPERDGILAGLLLLELMAVRRMPISEIIRDMDKRFGRCEYQRNDVHLRAAAGKTVIPRPPRILNKRVVAVSSYDGTKFVLDDGSWLIIRASGTEPIVRIYAESSRRRFTAQLIEFGLTLWKNAA